VTALAELPLLASGKVREMYDLGDRLLMVASDRISTYDVVHPNGIPDKGKVLTGLSSFWFSRTGHIVPNHFVSATDGVPDEARGRAIVARKLDMLPVECVVRGYITGSGWKDYQATGKVSGIELAPGLQESERLAQPIFTPSTKAEQGDHDEAIDFDQAAEAVGDRELMGRLRDVSIALYTFANEHARTRGVILADTKFEFGLDPASGELVLGDEVLLAVRPLRARPRAAELRQAVRARLGVGHRLGQVAAGAGDPRGRRGRDPREVRRGLRAHHGRAVRRLAAEDGLMPRVRVLVRPKEGILDPQGQVVEQALPALGFAGVANVHVGRLIELDVEDASQVPAMCERLLVNPLIEDFEVQG
jgi:phosphoribosylaminoimidazole-succinocarboxamide synthase